MSETILIIPGLSGSGPAHWQSHWEKLLPNAVRVEQSDWENPKRAPWVERLTAAIESYPDAVLVAHSLGCALVANTLKENLATTVRAALLVSPTDVERPAPIDDPLREFAPMPLGRFPFKTIVAASRNDPYVKFERASFFAAQWGAELVDVGEKGHINADSGLGDWPEGLATLKRLVDS